MRMDLLEGNPALYIRLSIMVITPINPSNTISQIFHNNQSHWDHHGGKIWLGKIIGTGSLSMYDLNHSPNYYSPPTPTIPTINLIINP